MEFKLTDQQRDELTRLAKRPTIQHRIARRANALVLLDRGMSCAEVASVLLMDEDTIRGWISIYARGGAAALERFDGGGSACDMTDEQIRRLADWVDETLPVSTRAIGAWVRKTFGLSYSRSGLIKLLGRAGLIWHKPVPVPRGTTSEQQADFIRRYEKLLNGLDADEAVMFIDAVHPAHQVRPVGCWSRRSGTTLAVGVNSGREHLNVHGAIDLATGRTVMIEPTRVDASSTIDILERIESRNPHLSRIVVFADNAAYHKARAVEEWLARPGRRVELRFIPVYCPHLNPIERLWGEMHRNVTHNRCHPSQRDFCEAALRFLRETVPKHFDRFRDRVSDNFRVIDPAKYRIMT